MKIIKKWLAFAISAAMVISTMPIYAEQIEEKHGTGLQAMTEERRNQLLEHARIHTGYEPIPYTIEESVDNSASVYFPSIGNQGTDGSCVAYATTYYQMTYTISKALGVNCSNYTFSPNWTYSLINSGQDQGSNEFDAYNVLSDFGAAKKSEFSGTKTKIEPKATVWKSAMKYKIDPDHNGDNWELDYFDNPDDFIISAKQALADGKVLTTGSNSSWWYGDNSYESVTATVKVNGSTKTQKGIAYVYDNGEDEGRHLITIVGYDDNVKFKYGSYSTTGGFKIANSWSTNWGNSGYIWVSYDAFRSDSQNRPSSRNGYGFISSWWSEGTDENVYYTINLGDNYSPYEAEYMGEVTMTSSSLSKMILSYMGKEDKNDPMSYPWTLYDGSYYDGLPTSGYSGTMVLDFSGMTPYIESENGYWEVKLDGLNSIKLKIVDANSEIISPQTSGKKWAKEHTHEYIEGSKTYDSSKGTWERTDTCLICDSTTTVSGKCNHSYIEGEKEYNSNSGTWSRIDTCSVCGYMKTENGECEHNYIEGEKIYSNTGIWKRTDTCSICGYEEIETGVCEHNYADAGIEYIGSSWNYIEICEICENKRVVNSGTCYFNMNFEDGVNTSYWINNGRGIISSVNDSDNTYMHIDYVNEDGEKPKYFEVSNPTNWYYSSMTISGPTEMSYDVKFGGNDGDVYLKRRAEDINDIVLRICCKEGGRLQYGTNNGRRTFYDADGESINPIDRWLRIRIVANITEDENEAKQTIYVTDKATGELISIMEDVNLVKNVPYCNLITIGASSTVDIDNIIVRDIK